MRNGRIVANAYLKEIQFQVQALSFAQTDEYPACSTYDSVGLHERKKYFGNTIEVL